MKVTTLKDSLHNTIHRHPKLSVEAIAEELNMAASYLARAALPDQDMTDTGTGVRFPLKQLTPLIRTTGDFQVLDHIEHSLGRVAIPIQPHPDSSITAIMGDAVKAASEFGELMGEIAKSCEDGELSEKEKDSIKQEGWEAITAISKIIYSLD